MHVYTSLYRREFVSQEILKSEVCQGNHRFLSFSEVYCVHKTASQLALWGLSSTDSEVCYGWWEIPDISVKLEKVFLLSLWSCSFLLARLWERQKRKVCFHFGCKTAAGQNKMSDNVWGGSTFCSMLRVLWLGPSDLSVETLARGSYSQSDRCRQARWSVTLLRWLGRIM